MNANHILDALEMIDDTYIIEAKERGNMSTTPAGKKDRNIKRTLTLVAVIATLLALCGFAAYQFGWFDPWLYSLAAWPSKAVCRSGANRPKRD